MKSTDYFIELHELYLVFSSKKVNILYFSRFILKFQVFDGETIDVSTPRGVFCGEVYPPAIISQVSVGLLITYHSQLAAVDEGFDIKFYRHEQGQCKI